MATVRFDQMNAVIGLDNAETKNLTGVLASVTAGGVAGVMAFFKVVGIAGALGATGPYIAGAIVTHVTWELAVINFSNKGAGVWLYADRTIWMSGGVGVVIPHTRTEKTAFDARANEGMLTSENGDEIKWRIDRGVGAPDDCKFVLVNECEWVKAYKLYIGPDTWWVQADGHQSAENGAWAHQLPQTQIVFHKPQFLGSWGPVGLTLANFNGLNATDITTFRWTKDN